MAVLSSPGIGSGLDVKSIVSQLMQVESQPVQQLVAKEADYNARLSAYGSISGALSSLQSAAQSWKTGLPVSANSADTSIFTATATSSAQSGISNIEITHLADYNKIVSVNAYSGALAAGTIDISAGTFDDANTAAGARAGAWSFTPDAGMPLTVNFAGGTLAQLRDAINRDAGSVVNAQIITGADGPHLAITSKSKGMDHALQITGNGALSDFSYDILAGSNATMTESSIPWSTEAIIDGVKARSDTNVLVDALPGVTITALKTSSPGVTTALDVGKDQSKIEDMVQNFIKAYNGVKANIKAATNYDAENKKAATLTGESTVRGVDTQLYSALTSVPSGLPVGSTYRRLSEIGITFDPDGRLQLDSDKLTKAVDNDATAVTKVLNEYGKQVDTTIKGQLDTKGLITSRTNGIRASIKDLDQQQESWQQRLDAIQARYTKQFNSLDTMLASMQKTSSYLQQQLAYLR